MGILARLTVEPRSPGAQRVPYYPRTLAGVVVTPDTAIYVPAVFACLRYLSQTVAVLPWHVMQKGRNGQIKLADSNPVDWLLWQRPNPEWSSLQFRETLTHWALRFGNGYAEIERDGNGRPSAIWPIHPDRVSVCRDPEDNSLYYEVSNDRGEKVEIPARDMFHIRGFGDGPVGANVMHYASESIGWARAAQLFGAAFFGNGGNLGGIVINKKALKEGGLARQKAEFDQLYKGPRNANKVAFLDNDADFKTIGLEPDKAQFIATQQHLVEEICRWFGVPPHKVMHMLRCMPADTVVYTEAGPKRIVDVVAGERVWSVTPDGVKLAKVLNNWENGVDDIIEISTTNRRVRCNRAHRMLVRRATERPLLPGEMGGRNVGGRKVRIEWVNEYVPAGDLKVGDTLVVLDRLPAEGTSTAPNGRALTPDFMAFCGLLLGDGNVSRVRGKPVGVQIARADSALYMDFYRGVMRREFSKGGFARATGADHQNARLTAAQVGKIRSVRMTRGKVGALAAEYGVSVNTVWNVVKGKSWFTPVEVPTAPILLVEGERQTTFKSVLAASELAELGFSGTARTKRVPAWVFGLQEDLRLALVRGFLDADGTVNTLGRIRFDSCNEPLLQDIRHLCMGAGIPVTNLRAYSASVTLPNRQKFISHMFSFTCSDPGSNRRIGSHDPRYVERMEKGRPFGRKGRSYPAFGGRDFNMPGGSLSRIAAIRACPAEPVFDLEVEGTHCFVADGVVVHNSTFNNIEHQSIEVVVDSITPWVKRFEDEANYKLFGEQRFRGFITKMNMNALLRGDMKARMEFYKGMQFVGAYSPNRILQLEDENEIGPEGDIHVMQQQMVPLEFIAKGPAQLQLPLEDPNPEPEEPEEDPEADAVTAQIEQRLLLTHQPEPV